MIAYLYECPATGRLVKASAPPEGITCAEMPADHSVNDYVLIDGEAVPLPPRPGVWAVFDRETRAWVDPRSAADLAAEIEARWAALRVKRDRRLTHCDWTQVTDNALTSEKREEWRQYRQALRDLPEITTDPAMPVWPVPPNE
jgi:hypothetical protein